MRTERREAAAADAAIEEPPSVAEVDVGGTNPLMALDVATRSPSEDGRDVVKGCAGVVRVECSASMTDTRANRESVTARVRAPSSAEDLVEKFEFAEGRSDVYSVIN